MEKQPDAVQAEAVVFASPTPVNATPHGFLPGYNRLIMKQKFEGCEALAACLCCGCVEFENKYDIFDANSGQPIMFAKEESNCCFRCCFSPGHCAKVNVYDVRGGASEPIFTMDKPCKCPCPYYVCIPFCMRAQNTTGPNGARFGRTYQHFPCGGGLSPKFGVKDETGKVDMNIVGPFCCIGGCCCEICCDMEYEIQGKTGNRVGSIKHENACSLSEFLKFLLGDSDRYIMETHNELTPEQAATLVSSMILLDYTFYDCGPGWANNCCICYFCGACSGM